MKSQQIPTLATPKNVVNVKTNNIDNVSPYTFQEWLANHIGVIAGQEYQQYNLYLTKWYTNKNEQVLSTANQIRLNYLSLLSQLQLFIPNEQLETWYTQINVNDERELLLAIPYYAKRLRDIALYYCRLRDTLKKAKLQYNLAGTDTGLVQQILNEIQTTYTQRPYSTISLPASVWNTVPQLSSIQDTINVQIEELYDFQSYLGQSPAAQVSEYFDLTDTTTTNYFESLGLTLSSSDWIYKTGNIDLSANSSEDFNIAQLQNLLASKYIGEDKFTGEVVTASVSSDYTLFNIGISAGNNFFYWPHGPYISTALNRERYASVDINQSGLNLSATAGETVETADTVFTKTAHGVEGAWFRLLKEQKDDALMLANIKASGETIFRFPFPGYGLSGNNINWTGASLSSTPLYNYLPVDSKLSVEQAYWNTNLSLTSVNPLSINDTTLIDSKAYASTTYRNADKVQVWQTPPNFNAATYSGEIQEAWLYAMHKTDIPIAGYNSAAKNSSSTVIWPFGRIDSTNTTVITGIPSDISNVCNSVPLTGVYLPNATAGITLDTADVIYKVKNYTDTFESATECAWLSGSVYSTPLLSAVCQPGFNAYFTAGKDTTFVWLGPNNTDINDIFQTINHEPDCKYVTSNASYLNSTACTCRSVHFTPFGHPGNSYTDHNGIADHITAITNTGSIIDAAWYNTHSDIGWGDGRWVTTQPCSACLCSNSAPPVTSNFKLKTGQVYRYYRANVHTQSAKTYTLPGLVIRYYFTNPYCNWVKAVKDHNNNWISSTANSDMIVHPGDILKFTRAGNSKFALYGYIENNATIAKDIYSIWSDYDYVTVGTPITVTFPQPTYTNPKELNQTDPWKQYPLEHFNNIVSYDEWHLHDPLGQPYIFKNTGSFTFVPSVTGIYTVALTATVMWHKDTAIKLKSNGTFVNPDLSPAIVNNTDDPQARELYVFTCIPPITAVLPEALPSLTSYQLPAPGYVINTPLKGWSYNMCAHDPCVTDIYNSGARPFWAVSYSDKTIETNFRSIPDWGVPQRWFDEHNCVTQPIISNITLSGGEYFKYIRNYSTPIKWYQPVTLSTTINKKTWCELDFYTLNLAALSSTLNNIYTNLVTTPLTSPSTLLFDDHFNNQLCEVYYNAINPFTWQITATPILQTDTPLLTANITTSIVADAPWKNILNKFYPTFATTPYLGSLASPSQIGDFFSPNKLGLSYFIDKNYTYDTIVDTAVLSGNFGQPTAYIGGRGLTRQDQVTPYTIIEENNTWLKEPTTAGVAAGNVKKSIAQKYQKFIPYQSNIETSLNSQVGFITTDTLLTPWGGLSGTTWVDNSNTPASFTGELNVNDWYKSQVITQAGKELDIWATDIYNNQYGLFKDLKNITPAGRKDVLGTVWVKTGAQNVLPASVALSSVYGLYSSTHLYNEITDNGVSKLDVFYDTLYTVTSGSILLNKLTYDYSNNTINTSYDNARGISLAIPVKPTLQREVTASSYEDFTNTFTNFAKVGDTWFFPESKNIVISLISLLSGVVIPELYDYNIIDCTIKKIFPVKSDDVFSYGQTAMYNIVNVEPPVLSYDDLSRKYVLSVLCKDVSGSYTIFESWLTGTSMPVLTQFNAYSSTIVNIPNNEIYRATSGVPLLTILGEYIVSIT